MQSVIWKLSALATVVGMGLTGVVYQQGGFGKSAGTPAAAVGTPAPGAPVPKVPGGKTADGKPVSVESADPFAGGDPAPNLKSAPPQVEPETVDQPPEMLAVNTSETGDEPAMTSTRSRTRARARNAPPETEFVDARAPQGAEGDDPFNPGGGASDTGNRGPAAAPPNPGVVRGVDPDQMEGSVPGDQESNALTSDDPFGNRGAPTTASRTSPRGNPARSTASRSRPSMNEADDDVVRRPGPQVPSAGVNDFDQGGEPTMEQPPSVVSKSRSRPRRMFDEESAQSEPLAPAAAEIVEQVAADPQDGSVNHFQTDSAPLPRTPAGKRNRPRMDDGDEFPQQGAGRVVDPAAITEMPATGPRTRPQGFAEDGGSNVESSTAPSVDGAQPILKRNQESDTTDLGMTPAVAQGGRRTRPNKLTDDNDDDGLGAPRPAVPGTPGGNFGPVETDSRGRQNEPEITDSVIPAPTQRPSPNFTDTEPTDQAGVASGQPQSEAAVSRDAETKVIPVPKRLGANADYPGAAQDGRGRPHVTIEKRAPATAYIGQPLIYQIFIRNVGAGVAQQVVVEDIVPEGVAMQGSIPQAELVTNKLSWKIGSLKAGEERKISVKVIPGAEGAIGSAARVSFVADPALYASTGEPEPVVPATPVGPNPSIPGTAGTVQQTSGGPIANLDNGGVTLDIQGPRQIGVGQAFDIRFRLTNRTNQAVTDVMIRKVLPPGLQHQTRIQDLEYRVGTLAPAESRDITMTLTAIQPGRAVSRVMIMGAEGRVLQSQEFSIDAGASGNQSSSADLPVTLERLGSTRPAMNRPTAYANRLTNRGSQTVSQLRVTETIPKGMEFVSAGDGGQYDKATRQVVWKVASLEPQAATDLEISLIAKDKHPQQTAVVVADRDGNQLQTAAQVSAGGAPQLSVEVVPPQGPVQVGDPVVYEIRVANKGTEVVQQASVRVSVPAELQLAKAGPLNVRREGTDLIFDAIPALNPGRQALLTAEFIALAPGDARLRVQFVGAHMKSPVFQDENLRIAAK